MNRWLNEQDHTQQILYLVHQVRMAHPTMGLRDMYYRLQPDFIGRDRFEMLCKECGFAKEQYRNLRRTTDSSGVIRFPNLLKDVTIVRLNQFWQSDITYYELGSQFCYLTFMQDSYSRLIIGHEVSRLMYTKDTTIPTLLHALKRRKGADLKGLILHSDGGGQYYAKAFLALTKQFNIQNSMCEYAWENGMAERLNGVIKNNYLKHRNIKTFSDLKREVDRSVELYNYEKPHKALNKKTPIEFEKEWINLQQQIRPTMKESS